MCEIQKYETIHGWNYDDCGKCAAKVKGEVEDFVSPQCKKKPTAIEPKYVLEISFSFISFPCKTFLPCCYVYKNQPML